jgi:hypothetical protein
LALAVPALLVSQSQQQLPQGLADLSG